MDECKYDIRKDFTWFIENYKEFQEKYGNCFIAIKDKKVLGTYSSLLEGIHETSKEYEIGTFIVQECAVDHEAYNATAYRSNIVDNSSKDWVYTLCSS